MKRDEVLGESRCPECGTSVDAENWEAVEDGDYIRYDCPVCDDPVFTESATKDIHDRAGRNPIGRDSPLIEDEEFRSQKLDDALDGDVSVQSEEGVDECVRPRCDNTEDLERIEYEDGGHSGPLCPACRADSSRT